MSQLIGVLAFRVVLPLCPLTAQVTDTLIVATRNVPPFAIREADGSWTGIGIDLWRMIAEEIGLDYEYREMELPQMLEAVRAGTVAAAVAALTITAEREAEFDFTHPFFQSGLSIAVPRRSAGIFATLVSTMLSPTFVRVLAAMALVLVAAGSLLWIVERRRNPEQFEPGLRGIGDGFWWAAVTMTTVGYGDKAPRTLAGRVIGLVWMFASIVMISGFTAGIATALTVSQMDSGVRGPDDLSGAVVGSVGGSTSEQYLFRNRIRARAFTSLTDALQGLLDGNVAAVVYDEPLLRFHALTVFEGRVEVLPNTFERQDYSIGLPTGSELRERINRVLPAILTSPRWADVTFRYMGSR